MIDGYIRRENVVVVGSLAGDQSHTRTQNNY